MTRKSSRDVLVDVAGETLRCAFRGRMRQEDAAGGVLVGDRVLVERLSAQEGIIEKVLPRRSELVRETAGRSRVAVAANVDQVLALISARDPPPRWALVDRMLIAAERDGLAVAIGLNKLDQLDGDAAARGDILATLDLYRGLGYPAFAFAAAAGVGLEPLRAWLGRKTTVVSGHSGVGKSTLLNALCPGINLETGHVNAVTGRGRHTTTAVTLFPLAGGGHAADTPGFREFMPADLAPAELGRHYPEFLRVLEVERCRYNDCLHRIEPACAVRRALERGEISPLRYQSYVQILESLRGDKQAYPNKP